MLCFRVNQTKPRNRKGRCLDFVPGGGVGGLKCLSPELSKAPITKHSKVPKKKKNDAFPLRELLSSPQWLRFSKMESKACTKSVFTRDI